MSLSVVSVQGNGGQTHTSSPWSFGSAKEDLGSFLAPREGAEGL